MPQRLILLVIASIVGFASSAATNADSPQPRHRGIPEGGDPGPQESGLFENVISRDVGYAWQSRAVYVAPDSVRFFPDDPEAGKRLDALFVRRSPLLKPDRDILRLVRLGLRRTEAHRTLVLQWVGNTYVWNVAAQDRDAIELMYHAADFRGASADRFGTRHAGVYFGLSTVEPKTPAIVRTLVDLSLRVDDPNDLDRVAWGIAAQRDEALELLRPHLTSAEVGIRDKARVLERMFKGELNAFDWTADQARKRALEKYADQFPQFKYQLNTGDSVIRKELLQKFLVEQILWAMDDSFLPAFARCAEDASPEVRNLATIIIGNHWIWRRTDQHPDAVALTLQLSRDPDFKVRFNAIYYGLIRVRNKDDAVILRLIDVSFNEREWELPVVISKSLHDDRERTRALLQTMLDGADARLAAQARERYKELTGEEPPEKK